VQITNQIWIYTAILKYTQPRFKNNFTIDFSALNQKKYQIVNYSVSGERVCENKIIDKSRININSEGFIPGIFLSKS